MNASRISVSAAIEMPTRNQDGKTTFKMTLPSKVLVAMPGTLTQVFMKIITKDNKHLIGERGDRISLARQVQKHLMPKNGPEKMLKAEKY